MDRDRLIKDFYNLFLEEKAKASFYDELPEVEAEMLINKLQYPLKLINEKLEVRLHPAEDNNNHLLVIDHDNTDEVAGIAVEVVEKAPNIDNWIISIEARSMNGPILEYDPLGSESDPDSYLVNVYLSIIPIIPRTEGPMFNLNIYMNEMDSEYSRLRIKFFYILLLGEHRITKWVKNLTFISPDEHVPENAIPFVRSDIWIEVMESYNKQQ